LVGSLARGQQCDTVTDIDGNEYPVVTIGGQCWMAENLKTTRYRDGSNIPNVTDYVTWGDTVAAWCNYLNNASYDTIFGKLYNWYTAANPDICPFGWHVPSDAEWTMLTDHLGGVSVAGGPMKAMGTDLWSSPNAGATNASGFSALPGGYRINTGGFVNLTTVGYWWSVSELSAERAWYRTLITTYAGVGRLDNYKTYGYGVRCLRDISVGYIEEGPARFTLAPNPTHLSVTIGFASTAWPQSAKLLDAHGRTIAVLPTAGQTTIVLDVSGYENGLYLVQVHFADGTQVTERVVKE
jgi:uncharacterized protein (TIGR02145 family)